ncbi:MAG: class I SAM-dependent rRNA methyltransferase [Bdellovibrionaceae bacterium]|nr:class I SAM-dependent rRNA methyltransferase [Pseudobdellovibrionaceae bacterium]
MKIKIIRNLRKSIKQGHPWVYREAIEGPRKEISKAQLAQVMDGKGELGWAIYDPHSPLALRMLNISKHPPKTEDYYKKFSHALELRKPMVNESTNAYRLFNGEGDRLPGLVCDVYGSVAILQFDGLGPSEFWNREIICDWLLKETSCKSVYEKFRRNQTEKGLQQLAGKPLAEEVLQQWEVRENGHRFLVNLEKGQKTGFFLDQRDNRHFVETRSRGRDVLNLFSYTGGFSIYAGMGGAKHVTSVDLSEGAIELAKQNWSLNGLSASAHTGIAQDVFEFLKNSHKTWDHIIVDPPSMTHSEQQKKAAQGKYIEAFSAAAEKVRPSGELSFSSCSSHIHFDDFFKIIEESLSLAKKTGRIVRVSGQGIDHPFPHVCPELRYLKFVHILLDQ